MQNGKMTHFVNNLKCCSNTTVEKDGIFNMREQAERDLKRNSSVMPSIKGGMNNIRLNPIKIVLNHSNSASNEVSINNT